MKSGVSLRFDNNDPKTRARFTPDEISAVDQLTALKNGAAPSSSGSHHDRFDVLGDSIPASITLTSPTKRPDPRAYAKFLAARLKAKGYVENVEHYAEFFVDFINTAQKINASISADESSDPRAGFFAHLANLTEAREKLGAISPDPEFIFEQNNISDEITKLFLETLFNDERAVAHLYGEMLFKSQKQLSANYFRDKEITALRARLDHILLSEPYNLPESEFKIHDTDNYPNLLERVASVIEKLRTEQADIYNLPEIQNLIQREQALVQQLKEKLNTPPRCLTILPCLIQLKNGTVKTIALIGASGITNAAELADPYYEFQLYLKEFCDSLNVQMGDGSVVSFQYVEHATRQYDWLLHESNRAIHPNYASGVLPSDPGRECSEKKVFSELTKHFLELNQTNIASITVLGDTNIALPQLKDWELAVTEKPDSLNIYSQSEAEKCYHALELVREKSPYYLEMKNQLQIILEHLDHLSDACAQTVRDSIEFISEMNFNTVPKSIYRSLDVAKAVTIELEKILEHSSFQTIQRILNNINLRDYIQSARLHIKAEDALKNASPTVMQAGFYIASRLNPNAGSDRDSKTYYYPIQFKKPCTHCQKQKMPYLAVALHASKVELSPPKRTDLPTCSSSSSPAPSYMPSYYEQSRRPLKLSPKRCEFTVPRPLTNSEVRRSLKFSS